ncbi:hypothetical protein [Novosphingobium sp. 9U]|uniref:hypothetical protein n=1 Tax=Novosphingobium sp. 9U TaxID=2653158 RepID=UPI0012F423B2|nr:hypothetical protein [Novosphingobium sp. 9U]VWX51815.1 hypothetical protein NOVOSPHI9U_40406 [Novosphingobium sp. 9U]
MGRSAALLAIGILSACSQKNDSADTTVSAAIEPTVKATAPPAETGKPFDVASDPNASYLLLKVERGKGDNIVATTRRYSSKSGASYSIREIDCADRLFRYLGSADTLGQAKQGPADEKMADLVPGSIADVTVTVACAHGVD